MEYCREGQRRENLRDIIKFSVTNFSPKIKIFTLLASLAVVTIVLVFFFQNNYFFFVFSHMSYRLNVNKN